MGSTNNDPFRMSEEELARFQNLLVANALISRLGFPHQLKDPRRDINKESGYPELYGIDPQEYRTLYDEFCIATRVVDLLPIECWGNNPEVYEEEDEETETEFEKAWKQLARTLGEQSWFEDEESSPVWSYLERIDRLSGIGHFGLLLLGINDGRELETPLEGFEGLDGDPRQHRQDAYTALTGNAAKRELLFLQCYDESQIQVVREETDRRNRRYGLPVLYDLRTDEPNAAAASTEIDGLSQRVHWSRVIHVAENLSGSEAYAIPRMRPVVHRLLDLKKLYSGSAEMFWKGGFPGFSFETHPELGTNVHVDQKGMQEQLTAYENGLQRYLSVVGQRVNQLSPQVSDPTPHIERQLEAICILLGVPKRIFMGSERGELASSQDKDTWDVRVADRQTQYLIPKLIVPFINRLIRAGVLPVPKKGFHIKWPDVKTPTALQKAELAAKRVEVIAKYVGGGLDVLISPLDFLVKELDYDREEAEQLLENALEHVNDANPEEEDVTVPGRNPKPQALGDDSDQSQKDQDSAQSPQEKGPTQTSNTSGSPEPPTGNELVDNDCGTGPGGFQPGNVCARGGGGGEIGSVYHGTSSEVLESILGNGLKGSSTAGVDEPVFAATSYGTALEYAINRTSTYDKAIVFHVDSQGSKPSDRHNDYVEFEGMVKPDKLKNYDVIDLEILWKKGLLKRDVDKRSLTREDIKDAIVSNQIPPDTGMVFAVVLVQEKPTGNELVDNNCGTGSGGFKPGNTCARGGGGDGFPSDPTALETIASLGGSTGATLVKDPKTGKKYVRKAGNHPDHIRSEYTADKIYEAAGVDVPKSRLYETDQGPVKLAEYIEGAKPLGETTGAERQAAIKKLQEDFALDATLGNWDVVGQSQDNVLVKTENGETKVYRIDNGGALSFRAQGSPKGDAWNGENSELETMRNNPKNPSAKAVYGSMTNEQISASITKMEAAKNGIAQAAIDAGMSTDNKKILNDRYGTAVKLNQQYGNDFMGAVDEPFGKVPGSQASPAFPSSGNLDTKFASGSGLVSHIVANKGGTKLNSKGVQEKIAFLNPDGIENGTFYLPLMGAVKSDPNNAANIEQIKKILPEGTAIKTVWVSGKKIKAGTEKHPAGKKISTAAQAAATSGAKSLPPLKPGTAILPGGGGYTKSKNSIHAAASKSKTPLDVSTANAVYKLDQKQAQAVKDWTNGEYRKMRIRIAAGTPNEDDKNFLKALDNLPNAPGVYYRGLVGDQYASNLVQTVKTAGVGGVWSDASPHSMTRKGSFATGKAGTNGLVLVVKSKTAKSVENISLYATELEVIGKPKTNYRILGIHENVTGESATKSLIELEEI